MNKKLLVLGGGENQVPLIRKAKQLGYRVVLCDYLTNIPGKTYSDVHYMVSTHEYEAVLEVAKKEKINGITTNSEPVLHVMARLADELGLPSITEEKASLFLNKGLMRDHLTKCGLSTLKYKCCGSISEAVDFFQSVDNRMIMKPVDSSASRGVYTINNEGDIRQLFSSSRKANRRSQEVLLEEYMDGHEFSVDGICVGGKHYSLGVAKKKQFSYNKNLDKELYFSFEDDEFDYNELRRINNETVESTGLAFGMTHAEYKFTNGKFQFIEMAARGGGIFISSLIVPYISGIDTVRIQVENSLGVQREEPVEIYDRYKSRCAVLKFFSPPQERSGIVRHIDGLDTLKQKGILKYKICCKVGDCVRRAEDGTDRLGYYIAAAETAEELKEIIYRVDENVVIGF